MIGAEFEPYMNQVNTAFMGHACVGTDLDRTMLYSANSMNIPPRIPSDLMLKLVELHNAKPLSYITDNAFANLETINKLTAFVPVTTRTEAQFKRIFVPGVINDSSSPQTQYAVTTNGAKILVNGVPDVQWNELMMSKFEHASIASFAEVGEYLGLFANTVGVERVRDAEGVFFTAIVKPELLPKTVLNKAVQWMAERNWKVSVQGKKIYFIPYFINKGDAFKEVASRVDADYTVTAGDSLLDISLFESSDIAFRPRHGELEDAEFSLKNLTVTDASGIFAGEEITARMLAQVISGI